MGYFIANFPYDAGHATAEMAEILTTQGKEVFILMAGCLGSPSATPPSPCSMQCAHLTLAQALSLNEQ